MSPLLLAWAAEAGIVTWRSFRTASRPPVPGDFVATFVLFGALGAIAESQTARPAATIAGWGIVLATVLNLGPFGPGAIAGGPAAPIGPPVGAGHGGTRPGETPPPRPREPFSDPRVPGAR